MPAINKWPADGRKIKRKEANLAKPQGNQIYKHFEQFYVIKFIKDARKDSNTASGLPKLPLWGTFSSMQGLQFIEAKLKKATFLL